MGLEGAGKTMLLNRMENKEYANYQPTISFVIKQI